MKTLIVFLTFIAAFCGAGAAAQSVRMADGKPCHPTEKTLFDMDGVTPFACSPTGRLTPSR